MSVNESAMLPTGTEFMIMMIATVGADPTYPESYAESVVDPYFAIDPSVPDPGDYTIEFSPGVENGTIAPEPASIVLPVEIECAESIMIAQVRDHLHEFRIPVPEIRIGPKETETGLAAKPLEILLDPRIPDRIGVITMPATILARERLFDPVSPEPGDFIDDLRTGGRKRTVNLSASFTNAASHPVNIKDVRPVKAVHRHDLEQNLPIDNVRGMRAKNKTQTVLDSGVFVVEIPRSLPNIVFARSIRSGFAMGVMLAPFRLSPSVRPSRLYLDQGRAAEGRYWVRLSVDSLPTLHVVDVERPARLGSPTSPEIPACATFM